MKTQNAALHHGSRTCAITKALPDRKPVLSQLLRLLPAAALALPALAAHADAVFANLYAFPGFPNGANPTGLVQGTDGNFYGTTTDGGAYDPGHLGYGTVFRM
jgi:hypothetical protein